MQLIYSTELLQMNNLFAAFISVNLEDYVWLSVKAMQKWYLKEKHNTNKKINYLNIEILW